MLDNYFGVKAPAFKVPGAEGEGNLKLEFEIRLTEMSTNWKHQSKFTPFLCAVSRAEKRDFQYRAGIDAEWE